jgi:hypothetical protein
MLSLVMQCVKIRAFTFVFHLTRFPLDAQMATRLEKSRVAFRILVAKIAIHVQNRLTSIIIPPTMQILTCTYVLVDKK